MLLSRYADRLRAPCVKAIGLCLRIVEHPSSEKTAGHLDSHGWHTSEVWQVILALLPELAWTCSNSLYTGQ